MQWTGGEHAGFTSAEPWIEVNKNHTCINAEAELADDDSIFRYYQKLVKLRKEYDVIAYGDFKALAKEDLAVFAYKRTYQDQELLVVNNFYGKETVWEVPENMDGYNRILGNYDTWSAANQKITLKPYESLVFYRKK